MGIVMDQPPSSEEKKAGHGQVQKRKADKGRSWRVERIENKKKMN